MADATGIVYSPSKAGFPHLAVVFIDGKLLHCEPVNSLAQGEAFLAATMKDMPEMIKDAREGGGNSVGGG